MKIKLTVERVFLLFLSISMAVEFILIGILNQKISVIERNVNKINELLFPKRIERNDCKKPINGYDLLFFYAPACPHCRNMNRVFEEIGNKIKVYYINVESPLCEKYIVGYYDLIVNHTNCPDCGEDFPRGLFTPTLVIVKNNITHVGEMQKDHFLEWFHNYSKK